MFGAGTVQVITRRGEKDEILVLALFYECLDGGESGLGRTAENKIPFVVFPQMFDKGIAWKSPVKEKNAVGRNMRQQALSLIALGVMDSTDRSGNRQLSEYIVDGHDKALGVVAFAAVFQSASGIEFGAALLGRGKNELGAVECIYGHFVPKVRIATRPELIGQCHSPAKEVLENGP